MTGEFILFVCLCCACGQADKKIQLHAANRDYQHLSALRGCAPSFSLNSEKRGSLGYIDMVTGRRSYPFSTKGTYAQTIGRDGYTIVGMGRPRLDNVAFARQNGFLSIQQAVYAEPTGNQVDGKSIFVPCKTLDQCFVDIFHYNGRPLQRYV